MLHSLFSHASRVIDTARLAPDPCPLDSGWLERVEPYIGLRAYKEAHCQNRAHSCGRFIVGAGRSLLHHLSKSGKAQRVACAIRVVCTSVIRHINFRAEGHLVSTYNLPNEGFKYLTLVRIAKEPIIPVGVGLTSR